VREPLLILDSREQWRPVPVETIAEFTDIKAFKDVGRIDLPRTSRNRTRPWSGIAGA
jgi:hypothetical protein